MALAKSYDVLAHGLRVRMTEVGDGPPALFIHGFVVDHREWLRVATHLAPKMRCILVDLPGHGKSERPKPDAYGYTREAFTKTLIAALDALKIERLHVCGHSMGGSIALDLAADHPSRVDKLVVSDSECYPFSLSLKARLPVLPVIGPIIFKKLYRRPMFHDYFREEVWSPYVPFDYAAADGYYDTFNDKATREASYATLVRTLNFDSLEPKIPRIKAPTLIIWGDEDKIVPASYAHRLAKAMTTGEGKPQVSIIERCGHAPNEEQPERVASLIATHCGV